MIAQRLSIRPTACLAALLLAVGLSTAPAEPASFRFTFDIKTPQHYAGSSVANNGGIVWSQAVSHPGADAIALHFVDFDLPPGDALFAVDERGEVLFTLDGRGPGGTGDFWTEPVSRESFELQLVALNKDGGRGFRLTQYRAEFADVDAVAARRAQVQAAYNDVRAAERPTGEGNERVVYGADDRLDVYQVSDQFLLSIAQAAVVVVDRSEISDNGNGTYTLSTSPWNSQGGLSLCAAEPFRGQLQIGFCSGYLVGDDILVTAGHCVSASSCGSTAYIFGFDQQGPTTAPNTVVSADNVYFCSSIINRVQAGDNDHCVLRLDRPVVGRTPLPIRHTGSVQNGDPLVMIGHPVVLPKKIAGGAVVKNANGAIPWFEANVDAYGGNSGSLVANSATGVIEGILVRGNADFVNSGGCALSNVLPDATGSGGTFEEITKTTSFEQFVPELVTSAGTLTMDRAFYNCSGTITFDLRDTDLSGNGTQMIHVESAFGDMEDVVLAESPSNSGRFGGTLGIEPILIGPANGILDVSDGDLITASYEDANHGDGNPATVTDTANADCTLPVISNVAVTMIRGTQATVTFDTDEPATPRINYGTSCGALSQNAASSASGTSHSVLLSGLTSLTMYSFNVQATDRAGNVATDDNGASCYTFSTLEQPDYFTELFAPGSPTDISNQTLSFRPDMSSSLYRVCRETASTFPTDPTGGTTITLTDDGTAPVTLTGGATVSLYGVSSGSFFVSANGNITFAAADGDYTETIAEHFAVRRIAGYWDDLDPAQGTGSVSWKQLADRVAVTWNNVPEHNVTNTNSFQIEMFFDGSLRITHLGIASQDGLVGLSGGGGTPSDFIASNLNAYGPCINSVGEVNLSATLYNCSSSIAIEMRDLDLAGDGTASVTVTTAGGDDETVVLTETPASSGIFLGAISAASADVTTGDGTLQVADGDGLTATYDDADDGTGSPATRQDSADVDCAPTDIMSVAYSGVTASAAMVTFATSESTSSIVHYGTSCGALTSTATGTGGTSHSVALSGLVQDTVYYFSVEALDAAGNSTTDNNAGACYSFTTLDRLDYFTERFTTGQYDLGNRTITFTPLAGRANDYTVCITTDVTSFPTDPAGGTNVTLTDDASSQVTITGATFPFYGTARSSFFINANGNLTFDTADSAWDETVALHFGHLRVAALFDDFDPAQGGTVSRKQLADRVVVTWQGVPQHNVTGDSNNFQIELLFDGTIAITFLQMGSTDGITGLSNGPGTTPGDFVASNISAYAGCVVATSPNGVLVR